MQSKKNADGTSGQNVPKSPKSKFRQKSNVEQTAASKLRMEKRADDLEKAKERLANQKPPKKPGPVKKAGRAVGNTVHGYVHGKIYEVEHENVGTEGAHQAEIVGEDVLRHGIRFAQKQIREHPQRAVQKAENRYIRATADYQYCVAVQEHPEMESNPISRYWQKQRIKHQYAKQAREAARAGYAATGRTAQAAGKAVSASEKAASKAAAYIKRHKGGIVLFLLCGMILVLLQSCMSSLVTIGNGAIGAITASTYAAEDVDLLGAEAAYCAMEAELQSYLDRYERTHDYDEYHYDLDEIEHDPYVLLSIVSALHQGAWTLDKVQGTLEMLFEKQYILTETIETETRYRTETEIGERLARDPYTGELLLDEYGWPIWEEYEYEVDVPYTYYICTVTLENFNLSHVPVYIMGEDELSRYALYMATLGNRPELFPDSLYVTKYTGGPVLHDVPEEYLEDETFAAILAEANKYVGYPYVWGGSSPATSFDCSGFVSYVYNQCGWNFGRLSAQGIYNICTRTNNPQPGDLVFFKGTYDTPGISHVGIYVGDGWMLHCGDPISYSNLNSAYWQSYFYAYGQLP